MDYILKHFSPRDDDITGLMKTNDITGCWNNLIVI